MTYNPHDGPAHGGGSRSCHFCRSVSDDGTRRLLGVATRNWYVSARSGARSRLVAGPFAAVADAVAAVDPVHARVSRDYVTDPRATFAAFGIASSFDSRPTLYGADADAWDDTAVDLRGAA